MKTFEKILYRIQDGEKAARIEGTQGELYKAQIGIRNAVARKRSTLGGAQVRTRMQNGTLYVWACPLREEA